MADFFEATIAEGADTKQASNWLMGEVFRIYEQASKGTS